MDRRIRVFGLDKYGKELQNIKGILNPHLYSNLHWKKTSVIVRHELSPLYLSATQSASPSILHISYSFFSLCSRQMLAYSSWRERWIQMRQWSHECSSMKSSPFYVVFLRQRSISFHPANNTNKNTDMFKGDQLLKGKFKFLQKAFHSITNLFLT